ncbi:MAG: hypothetical protein IBJ15_03240, partial [Alphaproteobacteria bacterium]|nr:hypothetical protein [Alphaproteobacteria bacterium]
GGPSDWSVSANSGRIARERPVRIDLSGDATAGARAPAGFLRVTTVQEAADAVAAYCADFGLGPEAFAGGNVTFLGQVIAKVDASGIVRDTEGLEIARASARYLNRLESPDAAPLSAQALDLARAGLDGSTRHTRAIGDTADVDFFDYQRDNPDARSPHQPWSAVSRELLPALVAQLLDPENSELVDAVEESILARDTDRLLPIAAPFAAAYFRRVSVDVARETLETLSEAYTLASRAQDESADREAVAAIRARLRQIHDRAVLFGQTPPDTVALRFRSGNEGAAGVLDAADDSRARRILADAAQGRLPSGAFAPEDFVDALARNYAQFGDNDAIARAARIGADIPQTDPARVRAAAQAAHAVIERDDGPSFAREALDGWDAVLGAGGSPTEAAKVSLADAKWASNAARLSALAARINPTTHVRIIDMLVPPQTAQSLKNSGVAAGAGEVGGVYDSMTNVVRVSLSPAQELISADSAAHESWHSLEHLFEPAEIGMLRAHFPGTADAAPQARARLDHPFRNGVDAVEHAAGVFGRWSQAIILGRPLREDELARMGLSAQTRADLAAVCPRPSQGQPPADPKSPGGLFARVDSFLAGLRDWVGESGHGTAEGFVGDLRASASSAARPVTRIGAMFEAALTGRLGLRTLPGTARAAAAAIEQRAKLESVPGSEIVARALEAHGVEIAATDRAAMARGKGDGNLSLSPTRDYGAADLNVAAPRGLHDALAATAAARGMQAHELLLEALQSAGLVTARSALVGQRIEKLAQTYGREAVEAAKAALRRDPGAAPALDRSLAGLEAAPGVGTSEHQLRTQAETFTDRVYSAGAKMAGEIAYSAGAATMRSADPASRKRKADVESLKLGAAALERILKGGEVGFADALAVRKAAKAAQAYNGLARSFGQAKTLLAGMGISTAALAAGGMSGAALEAMHWMADIAAVDPDLAARAGGFGAEIAKDAAGFVEAANRLASLAFAAGGEPAADLRHPTRLFAVRAVTRDSVTALGPFADVDGAIACAERLALDDLEHAAVVPLDVEPDEAAAARDAKDPAEWLDRLTDDRRVAVFEQLGLRGVPDLSRAIHARFSAGNDAPAVDIADTRETDADFDALAAATAQKWREKIKDECVEIAKRVNPQLSVAFAKLVIGDDPAALAASGAQGSGARPIAGQYDRAANLAAIALEPRFDPLNTMYHEACHSLEALLSDNERAALRAVFPDTTHRMDLPPALRRTSEENVAYAFADWAMGRKDARVEGPVATSFGKMRDFMWRLSSFLRGEGFQCPRDVFEAMYSGRVARRAEPLSLRVAHSLLPLATKLGTLAQSLRIPSALRLGDAAIGLAGRGLAKTGRIAAALFGGGAALAVPTVAVYAKRAAEARGADAIAPADIVQGLSHALRDAPLAMQTAQDLAQPYADRAVQFAHDAATIASPYVDQAADIADRAAIAAIAAAPYAAQAGSWAADGFAKAVELASLHAPAAMDLVQKTLALSFSPGSEWPVEATHVVRRAFEQPVAGVEHLLRVDIPADSGRGLRNQIVRAAGGDETVVSDVRSTNARHLEFGYRTADDALRAAGEMRAWPEAKAVRHAVTDGVATIAGNEFRASASRTSANPPSVVRVAGVGPTGAVQGVALDVALGRDGAVATLDAPGLYRYADAGADGFANGWFRLGRNGVASFVTEETARAEALGVGRRIAYSAGAPLVKVEALCQTARAAEQLKRHAASARADLVEPAPNRVVAAFVDPAIAERFAQRAKALPGVVRVARSIEDHGAVFAQGHARLPDECVYFGRVGAQSPIATPAGANVDLADDATYAYRIGDAPLRFVAIDRDGAVRPAGRSTAYSAGAPAPGLAEVGAGAMARGDILAGFDLLSAIDPAFDAKRADRRDPELARLVARRFALSAGLSEDSRQAIEDAAEAAAFDDALQSAVADLADEADPFTRASRRLGAALRDAGLHVSASLPGVWRIAEDSRMTRFTAEAVLRDAGNGALVAQVRAYEKVAAGADRFARYPSDAASANPQFIAAAAVCADFEALAAARPAPRIAARVRLAEEPGAPTPSGAQLARDPVLAAMVGYGAALAALPAERRTMVNAAGADGKADITVFEPLPLPGRAGLRLAARLVPAAEIAGAFAVVPAARAVGVPFGYRGPAPTVEALRDAAIRRLSKRTQETRGDARVLMRAAKAIEKAANDADRVRIVADLVAEEFAKPGGRAALLAAAAGGDLVETPDAVRFEPERGWRIVHLPTGLSGVGAPSGIFPTKAAARAYVEANLRDPAWATFTAADWVDVKAGRSTAPESGPAIAKRDLAPAVDAQTLAGLLGRARAEGALALSAGVEDTPTWTKEEKKQIATRAIDAMEAVAASYAKAIKKDPDASDSDRHADRIKQRLDRTASIEGQGFEEELTDAEREAIDSLRLSGVALLEAMNAGDDAIAYFTAPGMRLNLAPHARAGEPIMHLSPNPVGKPLLYANRFRHLAQEWVEGKPNAAAAPADIGYTADQILFPAHLDSSGEGFDKLTTGLAQMYSVHAARAESDPTQRRPGENATARLKRLLSEQKPELADIMPASALRSFMFPAKPEAKFLDNWSRKIRRLLTEQQLDQLDENRIAARLSAETPAAETARARISIEAALANVEGQRAYAELTDRAIEDPSAFFADLHRRGLDRAAQIADALQSSFEAEGWTRTKVPLRLDKAAILEGVVVPDFDTAEVGRLADTFEVDGFVRGEDPVALAALPTPFAGPSVGHQLLLTNRHAGGLVLEPYHRYHFMPSGLKAAGVVNDATRHLPWQETSPTYSRENPEGARAFSEALLPLIPALKQVQKDDSFLGFIDSSVASRMRTGAETAAYAEFGRMIRETVIDALGEMPRSPKNALHDAQVEAVIRGDVDAARELYDAAMDKFRRDLDAKEAKTPQSPQPEPAERNPGDRFDTDPFGLGQEDALKFSAGAGLTLGVPAVAPDRELLAEIGAQAAALAAGDDPRRLAAALVAAGAPPALARHVAAPVFVVPGPDGEMPDPARIDAVRALRVRRAVEAVLEGRAQISAASPAEVALALEMPARAGALAPELAGIYDIANALQADGIVDAAEANVTSAGYDVFAALVARQTAGVQADIDSKLPFVTLTGELVGDIIGAAGEIDEGRDMLFAAGASVPVRVARANDVEIWLEERERVSLSRIRDLIELAREGLDRVAEGANVADPEDRVAWLGRCKPQIEAAALAVDRLPRAMAALRRIAADPRASAAAVDEFAHISRGWPANAAPRDAVDAVIEAASMLHTLLSKEDAKDRARVVEYAVRHAGPVLDRAAVAMEAVLDIAAGRLEPHGAAKRAIEEIRSPGARVETEAAEAPPVDAIARPKPAGVIAATAALLRNIANGMGIGRRSSTAVVSFSAGAEPGESDLDSDGLVPGYRKAIQELMGLRREAAAAAMEPAGFSRVTVPFRYSNASTQFDFPAWLGPQGNTALVPIYAGKAEADSGHPLGEMRWIYAAQNGRMIPVPVPAGIDEGVRIAAALDAAGSWNVASDAQFRKLLNTRLGDDSPLIETLRDITRESQEQHVYDGARAATVAIGVEGLIESARASAYARPILEAIGWRAEPLAIDAYMGAVLDRPITAFVREDNPLAVLPLPDSAASRAEAPRYGVYDIQADALVVPFEGIHFQNVSNDGFSTPEGAAKAAELFHEAGRFEWRATTQDVEAGDHRLDVVPASMVEVYNRAMAADMAFAAERRMSAPAFSGEEIAGALRAMSQAGLFADMPAQSTAAIGRVFERVRAALRACATHDGATPLLSRAETIAKSAIADIDAIPDFGIPGFKPEEEMAVLARYAMRLDEKGVGPAQTGAACVQADTAIVAIERCVEGYRALRALARNAVPERHIERFAADTASKLERRDRGARSVGDLRRAERAQMLDAAQAQAAGMALLRARDAAASRVEALSAQLAGAAPEDVSTLSAELSAAMADYRKLQKMEGQGRNVQDVVEQSSNLLAAALRDQGIAPAAARRIAERSATRERENVARERMQDLPDDPFGLGQAETLKYSAGATIPGGYRGGRPVPEQEPPPAAAQMMRGHIDAARAEFERAGCVETVAAWAAPPRPGRPGAVIAMPAFVVAGDDGGVAMVPVARPEGGFRPFDLNAGAALDAHVFRHPEIAAEALHALRASGDWNATLEMDPATAAAHRQQLRARVRDALHPAAAADAQRTAELAKADFDRDEARARGFDVDTVYWTGVRDGEAPAIDPDRRRLTLYRERDVATIATVSDVAPVYLNTGGAHMLADFTVPDLHPQARLTALAFFDENLTTIRQHVMEAEISERRVNATRYGAHGDEDLEEQAQKAAYAYGVDDFLADLRRGRTWRPFGSGAGADARGTLVGFVRQLVELPADQGGFHAVVYRDADGDTRIAVRDASRLTLAWDRIDGAAAIAQTEKQERRENEARVRERLGEADWQRTVREIEAEGAAFDTSRLAELGFDLARTHWIAGDTLAAPRVLIDDAGAFVVRESSQSVLAAEPGREPIPVYVRPGQLLDLSDPATATAFAQRVTSVPAVAQALAENGYPNAAAYAQALAQGAFSADPAALAGILPAAGEYDAIRLADGTGGTLLVFDNAFAVRVAHDRIAEMRNWRGAVDQAPAGPALTGRARPVSIEAKAAAPLELQAIAGPSGEAVVFPEDPATRDRRVALHDLRDRIRDLSLVTFGPAGAQQSLFGEQTAALPPLVLLRDGPTGKVRAFDDDARGLAELLPDLRRPETFVEIENPDTPSGWSAELVLGVMQADIAMVEAARKGRDVVLASFDPAGDLRLRLARAAPGSEIGVAAEGVTIAASQLDASFANAAKAAAQAVDAAVSAVPREDLRGRYAEIEMAALKAEIPLLADGDNFVAFGINARRLAEASPTAAAALARSDGETLALQRADVASIAAETAARGLRLLVASGHNRANWVRVDAALIGDMAMSGSPLGLSQLLRQNAAAASAAPAQGAPSLDLVERTLRAAAAAPGAIVAGAEGRTRHFFAEHALRAAQAAPILQSRMVDLRAPDGTAMPATWANAASDAEMRQIMAAFAAGGAQFAMFRPETGQIHAAAAPATARAADDRAFADPFSPASVRDNAAAAAAPKMPHEMTRGEFLTAKAVDDLMRQHGRRPTEEEINTRLRANAAQYEATHRNAVAIEMAAGRAIDPKVLAAYRPDEVALDALSPDLAEKFGYDMSFWLYQGHAARGDLWPKRDGSVTILRASQEAAQADGAVLRAFALRPGARAINLDPASGGFDENVNRAIGQILIAASDRLGTKNFVELTNLVREGRIVQGWREHLASQGVPASEVERRSRELLSTVLGGLKALGFATVRYIDNGETSFAVFDQANLLPVEAVDETARAEFLAAKAAAPAPAPSIQSAQAAPRPAIHTAPGAQAAPGSASPLDFSQASSSQRAASAAPVASAGGGRPPSASPVEFAAAPAAQQSFQPPQSAHRVTENSAMSNSIAAPDQDLDATEESRRAIEEVIVRLESARARSGGRPLSSSDIRAELVDREYLRSDGTRDQLVNRALLSLVEATGVPVAPLAPGYMLFEHPKTKKFEAIAVEQFIREAGPGGKLEGVFGERQRALVETLVEWSGIAADNDPDLPRRLAEFGRDVSAIVAEAAPHATAQVVSRLFGQTDSSVLDSASLGGARERVGALTLENYNMFLISADPSQGSHVKAAYGEIYGLLAPLLRDSEKEALQQAVGKFEAALIEYETKEVADEIARREKEYAAAEARSPGSVEARAIKDRIEALRTIASGPTNGAVAKLNPNARVAEVFARWATLTRGMDADSRRRLDTVLGAGPVKGAWREAVDAARDTMRRTREEIAALGEDPDTLQSKFKSASAAAWNGFGRMLSVATGIGAAARERRATREAALLPIKTFERLVGGEVAQRRQEFDVGAVLPAIQAQRIARLANMPSLAVALNDAVKNDKEVSALSIYQRLRYVHSDAQIRQIIQKAGFHVINDREGRTTLLRDAREAEASMIRVATRVTPELAGETDGVVSDEPSASAVGAKRNLREAPNLAEQATRLPVEEWIRRAADSRMLMERIDDVKGAGGIARRTKTWVLPAVPALGLPEKAVDAADPRWKGADNKPDPYAFLRSVHAGLVKLAVDSNRYVSGAVIEEYRDQPWARAWTPQILDQARAPAARKRTPTVEKVIATVGRASGPEFAGASNAMPARAAASPSFSAGADVSDEDILRRAVTGLPQDAQAALVAIEARAQRRADIQFSAGAASVTAAYAANLTGHGREARGFQPSVEPLLYLGNLRPAPAADVAARLSAAIEAIPADQRTLPGADPARAGWNIQGLSGHESDPVGG